MNNKNPYIKYDRKIAGILNDLEEALIEGGVPEDEASECVDDFEEDIKELLAKAEGDAFDEEEDK
ncbi:MAG: hypothetical protein QW087_08200 [Methanomassiliicoccales archaeon]